MGGYRFAVNVLDIKPNGSFQPNGYTLAAPPWLPSIRFISSLGRSYTNKLVLYVYFVFDERYLPTYVVIHDACGSAYTKGIYIYIIRSYHDGYVLLICLKVHIGTLYMYYLTLKSV